MNYEGGGSLPLAQALFKVFCYPLCGGTPPQRPPTVDKLYNIFFSQRIKKVSPKSIF